MRNIRILKRIALSGMLTFFLLAILGNSINVRAQVMPYRNYNTTNGLVQSQVNTVCQDTEGFIWVGTLGGVNKFDGNKFILYTQQDGLSADWVTASCASADGDVWFFHWNGEISRYKKKENYFKSLQTPEELKRQPFRKAIAYKNKVYALTDAGQVLAIETTSERTEYLLPPNEGISVNDVSLAANGTLALATNRGIISFINGKRLNYSNSMLQRSYTDVSFVKNDLYVFQKDLGLLKLSDIGNANTDLYSIVFPDAQRSWLKEIRYFYGQNDGSLWATTHTLGALKVNFSDGGNWASFFDHSFDRGLNYNQVNCVFTDKEGLVWIGTDAGLNTFVPGGFTGLTENFGLADNVVWDVEMNKDMIVASTNNGVSLVSTSNFNVVKNLLQGKVVSSSCRQNDKVIVCTEEGELYAIVGTQANLLIKLNIEADQISACKSGIVIAGANGLYLFNSETRELSCVSKEPFYRTEGNGKQAMVFATNGNIYTLSDSKLLPVPSNELKEKIILSAYIDRKNNLWVGTYNSGVFYFNGQNWINFPLHDGLLNYIPFSLCGDDKYVWVGTNSGLGRIEADGKRFVHFGQDDGYMGVENNAGAISIVNHQIVLGSIMGLSLFNTRFPEKLVEAPVPYIKGTKANYHPIKEDHFAVKYNQNNLSFQFGGISQLWNNRIKYQYRLKGLDTAWIASSGTEVQYTGLGAGNYTFEVRCSADGLNWSKQIKSVKFTITPPFWKTSWFFIVSLAIVVGGIIFVVRLKARNFLIEKLEMESQILELNQSLKLANAKLKSLGVNLEEELNRNQPENN